MSPRYADDQLDLGVTASPRLSRGMRLALILLGLLLVPLSLPLAYGFAIISGGGHGSPFDGSAAEFAFGITFIAVPFLILLLGIASLACTSRTRLKIVVGLAAAVPATFALAVYFGYLASRPHEHPKLITRAPPLDLGPSQVTVQGGGKHVSIACNPSVAGVFSASRSSAPCPAICPPTKTGGPGEGLADEADLAAGMGGKQTVI